MTAIKICGITRIEDAELCAALGVERIGLNFWAGSPRRCSLDAARAIVDRVGTRIEVVAVTVDASPSELEAIASVGAHALQLHGDEPDEAFTGAPLRAYKAVRLAGETSALRALRAPGDEVLVDAFVPGVPGGSGAAIDLELAARVVRARRTWVAGGLTPESVAHVVVTLAPYGVDVASGVERAAGIKDGARVRAFVNAARAAR